MPYFLTILCGISKKYFLDVKEYKKELNNFLENKIFRDTIPKWEEHSCN
jgi:hypothetical protein